MSYAIENSASVFPEPQRNTAADYILECLALNNVDTIFGIPGGAIEPLFDAIVHFNESNNNGQKMKLITSRHEAGAAFMADGYTRETGRLGVCCATTGPGATNLVTGVASAYMERTPMLVLTPQTPMSTFGQHPFQDSSDDAISIVTMLSTCTRYNSVVTHIDQLKYKLMKAIKVATSHPAGPVHLSLPMDIWKQTVSGELFNDLYKTQFHQSEGYDLNGYHQLSELFANNKKLLFILGDESLPYASDIVKCAERLNANIITTPAAKGAVRANHPQFKGILGFAGHLEAEKTLMDENLDYVLAIGTKPGGLEATGLVDNATVLGRMIYISQTDEEAMSFQAAHLQIFGNIKKLFNDLYHHLYSQPPLNSHSRLETKTTCYRCCTSSNNISCLHHDTDTAFYDKRSLSADEPLNAEPTSLVKPQYLMKTLPDKLPLTTRFHVDAGNGWAWATHYLELNTVSTYRIGMHFGSMGWAIGAAIGAACGQDDAPSVCITGDGSYLMSGQEITVAVQQNLPVVFIVLNDSAYGMVKHGQQLNNAESIGFELPHTDFSMMAQSVGATGYTVRNTRELDTLDIMALLKNGRPVLLDVHIDPEQVPPMGSRLKALQ